MSGLRPSELLELKEPFGARLDFDFACAYRLDLYERDKRKQLARMIGIEIGKQIDLKFLGKLPDDEE
jgi:hypothetical protein